MHSGRDDTLEERYAIKFSFKLGKNATETYGMLQTAFWASCMNRALVFSSIRDSRKAGSLWGMMRGVGGVRKSIHQSWLVKLLELGLLCWGFNGVQEDIPREEASTLQIGFSGISIRQDNAPVHNSILVTDNLTKMGIKTISQPPYSPDVAPCDFCLFSKLTGCRYERIEEMKEAMTKVSDTLTQKDFQKLLERYNKCIATGRRLLWRGLEFHVCTINESSQLKKVWKLT